MVDTKLKMSGVFFFFLKLIIKLRDFFPKIVCKIIIKLFFNKKSIFKSYNNFLTNFGLKINQKFNHRKLNIIRYYF